VTPSFSHVFIVVEENHSYSQVVGNASMPYLNMLINNYGLATQYYANTHPSLPNYLWLTSGSGDGITTDVCPATVSQDNIVRHLDAAGISWRSYAENLPSVGFMGCSASGGYAAKHNPFVYFSDVKNSSIDQKNIVPFTQFGVDLANNSFPRYSFIVPNLCNDAHDCSLSVADAWLNTNIAPLLNSNLFQPGGDGVLIIVFDEGTDSTNGGGQIAWVIVGPKVKQGYRSTTLYQHQNTLRLMLEGLGVSSFPQAAATASDMAEFFGTMTSSPTPSPTRTATPSPTPTPKPTSTATPLSTPVSTPTASPKPTAIPTATSTAASTPIPASSPTPGTGKGHRHHFKESHGSGSPLPTPTPTPSPSRTPTPVILSTPTPSRTPTPVATPAQSPTPASINGVYDLGGPDSTSFASSVLANTSVDGLAIRATWSTVEPSDGTFNWSKIDTVLALAQAHGKKVSISVEAGIHTPSWVYAEGAERFQFVWDRPWGPPLCSIAAIPLPWDSVFQQKWSAFVGAFGKRYDLNPIVSHVKLTGVNGKTQETILPHSVNEDINNGQCMGYDDIANWQAAGYTRTKVEAAFHAIATDFRAAFPHKEFAAMFTPCPGGLPPIDQNGTVIPGAVCDSQGTLDLLNYGINAYGRGIFIGQNNGWSNTWIWLSLVNASPFVDTGYQENHALGSNFPAAVTKAVNDGAKFLEVYQKDLTDTSLQSAIIAAHTGLLEN
jgi:hypothetical protein